MHARARQLLDEGREKFLARDFPAAEGILTGLLPDVKGYADVHNMLGGLTAWEKLKLPLEKASS